MRKDAKVVLSLDYGTKKIGICIAETYTGQTKPLPIVKNDKSLHKSLDTLVEEWKPNLLIIGVPPKMTEGTRVSLAFNVFIKGTLGHAQLLNEIKL